MTIQLTHPKLASEWHPTLNGDLTPDMFSFGSNKKAWWLGECGHEWYAAITNRARLNRNCIYCSHQKILKGFNDLQTRNPELVKNWHPTLNGDKTPDMFFPASQELIYWICKNGHTESVKIINYVNSPKCKTCEGKTLLQGFNDLLTTHPKLASQWHPTRNNALTPNQITAQNWVKVWWICKNGHERFRSAAIEIRKDYICIQCPKSIKLKKNNLKLTNPELSAQIHPTLNGEITAEHVTKGSNIIVVWVCDKGHTWSASVNTRTHGSNCPTCHGLKTLAGFNDLATIHPKLAKEWHPSLNGKLTPKMFTQGSGHRTYWICNKNQHVWRATIKDRHRGTNCPKCGNNTSKPEQQIIEHILSINNEIVIIPNTRKLIFPYEIDIYIPEKKLAIEYNGLYWHTENNGKDKKYHFNKWLACKNVGVQLIQIWEDDWLSNPELIKKMIIHKLGLNTEQKVFARKTQIVQLVKSEAEQFMSQNHIQGFASGSYYVGLQKLDTKEIVAVMIVKKESDADGKTLNIIRYATTAIVVGGFTKLLAHIEKTYIPEQIITFSDNTVSNGGLYKNNGFIVDKKLSPDYMYVVNKKRKHKYGYRIKKFRNNLGLKYVDGYTERQLAELNNLPRIWDAGKIKWVKTHNTPSANKKDAIEYNNTQKEKKI